MLSDGSIISGMSKTQILTTAVAMPLGQVIELQA